MSAWEKADTRGMSLPAEFSGIVEVAARRVHDAWVKKRLEQGWTYGASRDDAKKTSPCLVGYDKLSEEERDCDRETAAATMQAILSCGYQLVSVHADANESRDGNEVERHE